MLRNATVFVLLLAVAACYLLGGPPSQTPRLQALWESAHAQVAAASMDTAPAAATARPRMQLVASSRACQPRGGANPVIAFVPQNPQVGHPVRFSVLTSWLSPRYDRTVFLAIGTKLLPQPFDLTGSGAPGCQFDVAWDSLTTLEPGDVPSGFWTRNGPGRLDFEWTPLPANVGQKWYLQVGISAPGENSVGLLTTHTLEVIVGP